MACNTVLTLISISLFKIPNPDTLHLQLFVNNTKYIYIKMAQYCQNMTAR